jgi:serine/threonine protein kinase
MAPECVRAMLWRGDAAAADALAPLAHSAAADVWALGVLAYILLCGRPPFDASGGPEGLSRAILEGAVAFDGPERPAVPPRARALRRDKQLARDPAARPSAAALLDERWLCGAASPKPLAHALPALRAFNARRALRGAAHAVLSSVRMGGGALPSQRWNGKGPPAAAARPPAAQNYQREEPDTKVQ